MASTEGTAERAVAGKTTGFLELGDEVTWEAVHFGVRQRVASRITRFERPHVFVDEMLSGAFHSFHHTHEFIDEGGVTRMVDTFRYRAPLGWLGNLADVLFLERYMRKFLENRATALKAAAEGPA